MVFVAIAALILFIFMRPEKYNRHRIHLPFDSGQIYHRFQKITIWLTAFYFLSSLILSLLLMKFPDRMVSLLVISGALTLGIFFFLFLVPVRGSDQSHSRQKLLEIADCYSELPVKGFVFVAIAVVLAAILYGFGLQTLFSGWSARIIPAGLPIFALFFLVALTSSFSTEVLSNTAVQLSFFVVALPLSKSIGFSALEVLIIITLSSTCAFMSPIATGVNGLAFGGIKGVSFARMLLVGFFMNIAGAMLIAGWVLFIVAPLLGI
jgi:sodium-dependent dicarboxylate transporter 2/3/5